MASRSQADILRAVEEAAREEVGAMLMALEGAGEQVRLAEEEYRRATARRDRLVWEANRAGLSQELIAQVTGLGNQPAVARAKRRHKERRVRQAKRGADR